MLLRNFKAITTVMAVCGASGLHAQGYLGIGSSYDFEGVTPFKMSVSADFGWDNLKYESAPAGAESIDSTYIRAGVGAVYGWADRRTQANIGLDVSVIHYLDSVQSSATNYNARLGFNVAHQFNSRLTLSNSFYVTYEIEPDFNIGATASSRQGQYFYGYNNASLSYAWTKRFSSVVGYTISGIKYDDVRTEDRLTHLLNLQARYAFNPKLTLVGEYRYGMTTFQDVEDFDSSSHYVLAGVEYAWSERTSMSLRAGAEIRKTDTNDQTAPYAEFGVRHVVGQKTSLNWYNSLGYDNSELGGTAFESRYSYRTGVAATHAFTDRLSGNAGVHYSRSTFAPQEGEDVNEQTFSAQIGLAYRLWENVDLTANYGYTILKSDEVAREYTRNQVGVGLQSTF